MPDQPVDPTPQPPDEGEPTDAEKLELVEALLDLIPDFVYVHDYDMRFRFANRRAAEYFGLDKSSILGRALEEVDPDKDQGRRFSEVCREIMRGGVPRLTDNLPYRRPDGSVGVLRQHDIPFLNPATGMKYLMGMSRDVTGERELLAEREKTAALERELEIARIIQKSLRPGDDLPCPAGLDLVGFCEPAAYAGGDFYDWFVRGDGKVVVCIGDVTGHGIGPALLAAECRAFARVLFAEDELPGAMHRLGGLMGKDLVDGRFVTFAAAAIDPATFEAEVLSAGHGPLVVTRRSGPAEVLGVQRPPLGIDIGLADDPPVRVRIGAGEALVAMSDGVFEARDASGRQFGVPGVLDVLAGACAEPGVDAAESVRRVAHAVKAHAGPRAGEDDVTLVLAQRAPEGARDRA
jgi:PAS domain S-box-containing protein